MGILYEIDTEARLVRIAYTENALIFSEWKGAMDSILQDPLFKPGYGLLFDRRNVSVAPEKEFGKSVSLYIQQHISQLSDSHFAMVVVGLATYGIMRMLQGFMGETEHFMIFRDIEKAKQWLSEKAPQTKPGATEII